ncbi:MAG TPA: hypothetical protein VLB76_00860 [Thermoanaerobaculia bacterium]|jgi:hypothetical protein|nr:hypothetical protein [Thermoanaerobaculia bacterium]
MSTNQSIAAQVSAPKPLSGQKNRSSENFKFLQVPASGNITVSMPDSTTCSIMQDVSGTDPVVTTIQNGAAFPSSKVKTGNNYYFATPGGTSTNFAVTLSGDL